MEPIIFTNQHTKAVLESRELLSFWILMPLSSSNQYSNPPHSCLRLLPGSPRLITRAGGKELSAELLAAGRKAILHINGEISLSCRDDSSRSVTATLLLNPAPSPPCLFTHYYVKLSNICQMNISPSGLLHDSADFGGAREAERCHPEVPLN